MQPRNTYEECVNFIVGDLDKAIALLDGKTMQADEHLNLPLWH